MSGEQNPDETVLTPTARLARAEKQRRAMAHKADGRQAWHSPEVLAFSSWLGRLRDDWFLVAESPRVPISASQALVLWQSVIDRDVFIGEPRVADMVAASWRLLHEYRIALPETWSELTLSEDSRQFKGWAERFVERCEQHGLIDEWTFARHLPELIERGVVPLPGVIRLSGFELAMTPLQRAVLDAAEAAGTTVQREDPGAPARWPDDIDAFAEDEDELRAAARWARARLEKAPDQQIAVAVPGLRERLGTVQRVFRQVFDPGGFALEPRRDEPWHISLGPALSRWPLVADALALLRIDPHRMSQPEAGALLRSPFLDGGESESRARASARCEIIRRRPYWLHAGQLAWQAGDNGAKRLATRLGEWETLRREHRDAATPSNWVARFQLELEAIGFGRGRALDSREFQVLQRFHDLLEDFSALDLVVERPLPRAEAVRRLGERAASASFRERNPGAPVEILGVEEALGSRFDAIRVTGLDHHTWPSPPRRDPFIPARLQSDVPAASAEAALARAREELTGLMRTAPVVTGSFSVGSDNEARHLTPLLGDAVRVTEAPADATIEPAPMDPLPEDRAGPEHAGGAVRGGTSVLQAQSNCPFRAFAEFRLGAADLTPPRPGLDARDRGSLVHRALEHFWRDLDGHAELVALGESALADRIAAARDAALEEFARRSPLALSDAGRAIEARCLEDALEQWLDIERGREPFTVTALEQPIDLYFGGLTFTGKIDRVDELDGGGALILDYKTGASGKNGWAPEPRLADVQLPAYAASLAPRPAALAFARLRPDSMGFDGLAEVEPGVPGLDIIGRITRRSRFKDIETWPSLIEDWRGHLESLAEQFRAGRAEVDPRDRQVCDYCHLHSLCRIHERRRLLETAEENRDE
jgi:probable DNA repair protein